MATQKYGPKERDIVIQALRDRINVLDEEIANHTGQIESMWAEREELQNQKQVLENAISDLPTPGEKKEKPFEPKLVIRMGEKKTTTEVSAQVTVVPEKPTLKRVGKYKHIPIYLEPVDTIRQTYAGKTIKGVQLRKTFGGFFPKIGDAHLKNMTGLYLGWMVEEDFARREKKRGQYYILTNEEFNDIAKVKALRTLSGKKLAPEPEFKGKHEPWDLDLEKLDYTVKKELIHGLCPHCGYQQKPPFRYRIKSNKYVKCGNCGRVSIHKHAKT